MRFITVAFLPSPCYNKDMEKKNTPQGAKYFKYKLTKGMIAVAVAAILLSLGGLGLSVYRLIKSEFKEVLSVFKSACSLAAG